MVRHVCITGMPGVGKTTLVKKIGEILSRDGKQVVGFYTEEVRSGGRRIGFDIVSMTGERKILSRANSLVKGPKVGQYVVQVHDFESLALQVLSNYEPRKDSVLLIDEIGKMEMFSTRFVDTVSQVLDAPAARVICTIPVSKGIPFVEAIRERSDKALFHVTRENRDQIWREILQAFDEG